jgi:hypothetical protein
VICIVSILENLKNGLEDSDVAELQNLINENGELERIISNAKILCRLDKSIV